MSLITDSDEYSPSIADDGTYVDQIPSFNNHPQGFRCPCSNKSYATRTLLAAHIRTVTHKRWVESLNANRSNHFADLEKERQLVKEQKIIMAQMQRDIARLEYEKRKFIEMIHFLSEANRVAEPATATQEDLLDFN
jgi:hypothetical protein